MTPTQDQESSTLFEKVTHNLCDKTLPALGLLISGQIASQQGSAAAVGESSSWRGCGFAADILKGIRKLNTAMAGLKQTGVVSDASGVGIVSTEQLLSTAERYVGIVSEMDMAALRKEDPVSAQAACKRLPRFTFNFADSNFPAA